MSAAPPPLKQIAMKFIVVEQESAMIRKWINTSLVHLNAKIDAAEDSNIKDLRSDVRVELGDLKTIMITDASENLPVQRISCVVNDLSAGGACVSISANQPLVKGGRFQLLLSFIAEGFSVRGHIVGLRKR